MAAVPTIKITNISSVTANSNAVAGIRQVNVAVDAGKHQALLVEGQKYPTGVENLGMPDFPVTGSLLFEQDMGNMLAVLAYAVASLVIVFKQSGAGGDKTVTISNCKFTKTSMQVDLQGIARPSIDFVAYSSDGAALPISST